MKRLVLPAILGLSTFASLVCKNPANAATNNDISLDEMTHLTTVDTENIPQNLEIKIDSKTEDLVYNYCYWETYSDGSTYWVCW